MWICLRGNIVIGRVRFHILIEFLFFGVAPFFPFYQVLMNATTTTNTNQLQLMAKSHPTLKLLHPRMASNKLLPVMYIPFEHTTEATATENNLEPCILRTAPMSNPPALAPWEIVRLGALSTVIQTIYCLVFRTGVFGIN